MVGNLISFVNDRYEVRLWCEECLGKGYLVFVMLHDQMTASALKVSLAVRSWKMTSGQAIGTCGIPVRRQEGSTACPRDLQRQNYATTSQNWALIWCLRACRDGELPLVTDARSRKLLTAWQYALPLLVLCYTSVKLLHTSPT